MGLLIRLVMELVLGAGKATGNRAVRLSLGVPAGVIAAGIAVSSAFLWTTTRLPQVHGLEQYAGAGGPVWVLGAPICAALTFIFLVAPLRGRYALVLLFGVATFGLTLGALADFQGGGRYGMNGAAVISMLASMLLALLVLILSFAEFPPVDSALAPLTMFYWGRLRHLRALNQFAVQRGWEVSGPAGWTSALNVVGAYDPGHRVTATSSVNMSMGSNSSSYMLSVKMESPADIIAFRISYQPTPRKLLGQVAAGESRMPGKPTIYYYLKPRPEEARGITQGFMTRLASVVEAGRPYLGSKRDFMHATPFGMRWTHVASFGLSAKDAELEPLLRWMRELCGLLEEVSLRPAVPAPVRSGGNQDASIWSDGGAGGYWNGGM